MPHRNGRVDVLPPDAKTQTYDIAIQIEDAASRLKDLRAAKDAAEAQIIALSRFDQLRARVGSRGSEGAKLTKLKRDAQSIEQEMKRVRKRAGELRALIAGGAAITLETAFIRIAREELPEDLFMALFTKAELIATKARP